MTFYLVVGSLSVLSKVTAFFFFFFPHITMRKFTDKMIKLENLESIIKFLCEVVHFRTYP